MVAKVDQNTGNSVTYSSRTVRELFNVPGLGRFTINGCETGLRIGPAQFLSQFMREGFCSIPPIRLKWRWMTHQRGTGNKNGRMERQLFGRTRPTGQRGPLL